MPIFGKNVVGLTRNNIANSIRGSFFVCPEDGYAQSITAYLSNGAVGTKVKAAIYRVSDMTFIAETKELTDLPIFVPAWVVFKFPSSLPFLQGGVEYTLVCWASNNCQFYFDVIVVNANFSLSLIYDVFPSTLTGATVSRQQYSVYCTYTTIPQVTLTISSTSGGTTTPAPNSYSHDVGSAVEVFAQPDNGYVLDHWEVNGTIINPSASITLTMDVDHQVTAVFTVKTHVLVITSTPSGIPFGRSS